MKILQRIARATFWYDVALLSTIAATLRKRAGLDSAEIKTVLVRYKQLRRANMARVGDIQSEYHLSWCSMILAVYTKLREKGVPLPQAFEQTGDLIFENMGAESVAGYISKALDKAKDRFAYIVNSSKQQERRFFGTTFDFYRPRDDRDAYHLRVKGCFYNNYFAANGAPELMAVACKWDMISWSKGIAPEKHGIRFTRPKTLGLDHTDCEFNFEKLDNR